MIHKLGFPLEAIANFKQREARLTFKDIDPPEWASWHDSLRAPCHTFHKVAPLADGQDQSERRVAGADINQLM